MAGNPESQSLDPAAAPPRVTPADTPSSALYDSVTPHGQGTAPYDIQAPQADLAGAFAAANAEAGTGVLYPQSDRQRETEKLLASPQGYGAFEITGGSSGGGGEDWPSSIAP